RGQGGCPLNGVALPQSCLAASTDFSPEAAIQQSTPLRSSRSNAKSVYEATQSNRRRTAFQKDWIGHSDLALVASGRSLCWLLYRCTER
ncbi:MAG: hypothetical protein V2I43_24875, partial [Parvularcula sp.]|nr:hypothetical protein [Parvularcula sp.]